MNISYLETTFAASYNVSVEHQQKRTFSIYLPRKGSLQLGKAAQRPISVSG